MKWDEGRKGGEKREMGWKKEERREERGRKERIEII